MTRAGQTAVDAPEPALGPVRANRDIKHLSVYLEKK